MLATCSSDNTIRIYSIEDGGAELITEINEYLFIFYILNIDILDLYGDYHGHILNMILFLLLVVMMVL